MTYYQMFHAYFHPIIFFHTFGTQPGVRSWTIVMFIFILLYLQLYLTIHHAVDTAPSWRPDSIWAWYISCRLFLLCQAQGCFQKNVSGAGTENRNKTFDFITYELLNQGVSNSIWGIYKNLVFLMFYSLSLTHSLRRQLSDIRDSSPDTSILHAGLQFSRGMSSVLTQQIHIGPDRPPMRWFPKQ